MQDLIPQPASTLRTFYRRPVATGKTKKLALTAARRSSAPPPAMIRLSVGVEHREDLIADLAQALDAV